MQKKIIALAIAGLASTAAFAQSNVTIYGVADVYYGHVSSNGNRAVNAINSGGLGGSRIGFKGVEDLGNGLKALFTLEYGLAMDQNAGIVGDQSSNGARQQFVGLTSDKFGTVVAGYLQTTAFDFACAANPLAGGALDGYNLISGGAAAINCGAKGRANNAVAYISPSFSGLSFAYNYARINEVALYDDTATTSKRDNKENVAHMVSLSYANGPISAGAVYSRIGGNEHGQPGLENYSLQNGSVNWAPTATTANFLGNNKGINEWGLRASYDFKVAKVFTSYQRENNKNVDGQNSKWQVSASVPTTATGAVHVMFAQNKMNENATEKDRSRAYSLAYTHGLSKRTTLYTGYTRISNQDNAAIGAYGEYSPGNSSAYEQKFGIVPTKGDSASVFAMGINHKF